MPTKYAHRPAVIESYENSLRVIVENEAIAQHRRGFGRDERSLDPRHYVALLAHKHRAAETALVLSDGRIPKELYDLFDRYRDADPPTATKRWTQVLALLANAPVDELVHVITHARARGTNDPAAIALLLRQHQATAQKPSIELHLLPESARIATTILDLDAYAPAALMEAAA